MKLKSIITLVLIITHAGVYAQDFDHKIKIKPQEISYSPLQELRLKIIEIKATNSIFEPGGTYIIKAKLTSEDPSDLSVFFGNTASESGGSSSIEKYSQGHRPEKKVSIFTVAMKMEKEGTPHLSVYSKKKRELKKGNCVYKLILTR